MGASIEAVKRLLALLLLAVFGLPLASPLLAMSVGADGRLPACCRRGGQHHCMGGAGMGGADASGHSRLDDPAKQCPFRPQASVGVPHQDSAPPTSRAASDALLSFACGLAQTESKWRVARDRSRQKRGPPAVELS